MYSKTISPRLPKAKPACAERELQRRPSRLSPLASSPFASRLLPLASPGQSPPARNANSNDDPLASRLSPHPLSPLASCLSPLQGKARLRGTRTPTVTLSAIGYRLSAIAYRLSPMECKTRLHRPDRIPTPAHEAPVPPNQDDAGASNHSGTRPCWQRRVRTGGRLLPSFLRRHSNPAASGARPR
jgi:hypothetical protein